MTGRPWLHGRTIARIRVSSTCRSNSSRLPSRSCHMATKRHSLELIEIGLSQRRRTLPPLLSPPPARRHDPRMATLVTQRPEPLLTFREVGDVFGVSVRTVRRLAAEGTLPTVRV